MFWDFKVSAPAHFLMDYYDIGHDLLADIVPTFGDQGEVSAAAADELGLAAGTPVTCRAGDQPNNALSLNVLSPGEITGARIELYDTDGSVGAARGAGIGAGIFTSPKEAFANLERVGSTEPNNDHLDQIRGVYVKWHSKLENLLNS